MIALLRTSRLLACAIALPLCAATASLLTAQNPAVQTIARTQTASMESLPAEMQGDLLMVHGSYAAALDAYQKAWPRTSVLWNKTGTAYHHLHALDEALKDYQMALKLDPRNAEAHNNLGAVYHGKHAYGLAENQFKLALKYQPGKAVSYCNLGTSYFAEQRYREGMKAYQKALQIDPAVFNPQTHAMIEEGISREARMATAYNMARLYAHAGLADEAMNSLRRALHCGFKDRRRLMVEKDFAWLRETAEFRQMMVEERLN